MASALLLASAAALLALGLPGACAQNPPPLGPYTVYPVDVPVAGVSNPTFRGSHVIASVNDDDAVFAYYPTSGFDPLQQELHATVSSTAGGVPGGGLRVASLQCAVPEVEFLGRGGQSDDQCTVVAGAGCTTQLRTSTCGGLDAPYLVLVELIPGPFVNVTVEVSEVPAGRPTPIAVTLGSFQNANLSGDVVFGPIAGVLVTEMIEAFVVPDASIANNWNTRVYVGKDTFPSQACGQEAVRCRDNNADEPCIVHVFDDCKDQVPTFAGNWYVRIEDRRNGPQPPQAFRFRARKAALPTNVAVALNAAPTQDSMSFGETKWYSVDISGASSPDIRFSVTGTSLDPADLVRVVVGNGVSARACADEREVEDWLASNSNPLNIDAARCTDPPLWDTAPVSVSFIRATNESDPLDFSIEVVNAAGPSSTVVTAGQVYNLSTLPNGDSWYTMAFPAGTLVPGAEFNFPLTNMVTVDPAVQTGAELRQRVLRGVRDENFNCGANEQVRCDNGVSETCAWSNREAALELARWSALTGDMQIFLEPRGGTDQLNFTFSPALVNPVTATNGVYGETTLAPGEKKIFSMAVSAISTLNFVSNATSGADVFGEYFLGTNADGEKNSAGGARALGTPFQLQTSCQEGGVTAFARFVNNGAQPTTVGYTLSATPISSIATGTPVTILKTSRTDFVAKFTTATVSSIRARVTGTPPAGCSLRISLLAGCDNAGNDVGATSATVTNRDFAQATANSGKDWVVRLSEQGGGGCTVGDYNATIEITTGNTCNTFDSLIAGRTNVFCNGTVAGAKSIAVDPIDFNAADDGAEASYDMLTALKPSGAPSTCAQSTRDFVCNYMYQGCDAQGFEDRSDQCREDCEALVTSCYTGACATDVCDRLTYCTPPTGTGTATATATATATGTGTGTGTPSEPVTDAADRQTVGGALAALALALASVVLAGA